jgi:hypothetical protein
MRIKHQFAGLHLALAISVVSLVSGCGGGRGDDRDNDDYRIHIPDELSGTSGSSSRDEASGGILATGIKWLFGS